MTAPSHRIAVIPGDGTGTEVDAGSSLLGAIEDVLAAGPDEAPLIPDLQGTGTTAELGEVIAQRVRERGR
jgi:tartrate dehydrogenase/decarboxylase / D-malate dehydrogenase